MPPPQEAHGRQLLVIYLALESNRNVLKRLPAAVQHDVLHAYSISLHPVFLTAVPVALVAFVLSWFLREVPLRTAAGQTLRRSASAADLGEGMGGAPTQRTSEQEAERVLTRLSGTELRRFRYNKLARAAGLDLPGSGCWVLTRRARQGATAGQELARQATEPWRLPRAVASVNHALAYTSRTSTVSTVTPGSGGTG